MKEEFIKKKISGIKLLNHVSDEEDTEQQQIANALIKSAGNYLDEHPGETICRLSGNQLSSIFPGKKRRQLSSFISNFDRYLLAYNLSLNNGVYWKMKSHKTDLDIDILLSRHKKDELVLREIVGNIDFFAPDKKDKEDKDKEDKDKEDKDKEDKDKEDKDKEDKEGLDDFSEEAQELIKKKTINEGEGTDTGA